MSEELQNMYLMEKDEIKKIKKSVEKEFWKDPIGECYQKIKETYWEKLWGKITSKINEILLYASNSVMDAIIAYYIKKIFIENIKKYDFNKKDNLEEAKNFLTKLIRYEWNRVDPFINIY